MKTWLAAVAVVFTNLLSVSGWAAEAATSEVKAPLTFGMTSVLENSASANRDRPSFATSLYLAPRLVLDDRMSVSLGIAATRFWLDREENPYDLSDAYLEVAHSKLLEDPWLGIGLSARMRAYAPLSIASRNAGTYTQLRLIGALSRRLGPASLGIELNGQKYFHRYTTTATDENPGSEEWQRQAGREDYIENNASYGFGETVVIGFDYPRLPSVGLRWSMLQSRHYPGVSRADEWGSSLLQQPRSTGWVHAFRFSAEISYELLGAGTGDLGSVSSIKPAERVAGLTGAAISVGYDILAPQLQEGGRVRSLDPFNPLFGQFLVSLTAQL